MKSYEYETPAKESHTPVIDKKPTLPIDQPIIPSNQSSIVSQPTVNPAPSGGGGNGMPWCSGPQAPGWNVSLPNGGCEKMSATSTELYGLEKPTHIRLDQIPYTGTSQIDLMLSSLFYGTIVVISLYMIVRLWPSLYSLRWSSV